MLHFFLLSLAFFADFSQCSILPASGVAYNIEPFKGVGDRYLLSTNRDGTKVDLWHEDDDSGRQQWVPELIDEANNIYNIKIWDGVSSNRVFLSTTSDGKKVDLYDRDDGSGRQQWKFIQIDTAPSGLPIYRIQIVGGTGSRVYLSTIYNGEKADLYHTDDDSGRQQWILTPIDIELVNVEFDVDGGEILDTTPTVLNERYLCNDTPLTQTQTWSYIESKAEVSTYTYEAGFTVAVSFEKSFGTPAFTSGSISLSLSTTHTWTTETSTTETKIYENSFPVQIPEDSGIKAQSIITEAELDVPYTATFQSQLTGQTVTQTGTWTGVSFGSVIATYTSIDLDDCLNQSA